VQKFSVQALDSVPRPPYIAGGAERKRRSPMDGTRALAAVIVRRVVSVVEIVSRD